MQAQTTEKRPHGTGSFFDKNGSTHYRWRPVAGKPQVSRKVCAIGAMTKTQKEARAREIEGEYAAELEAREEQKQEIPLMGELGKRYIKQLKLDGNAPAYVKNRECMLRNHVNPVFEHTPVTDPKPKEIKRFKTIMQEKGAGPSTIISALWLLSSIFKLAIEDELRNDNPVAAVEFPKYNRQPEQISYLTPAEVERVIAQIPDDKFGKVERPMYRTAHQTGMRRGELLAVRWEDCDFFADKFHVSYNYVEGIVKQPKGRKGRPIPMTPIAKAVLLEWRKESPYTEESDLVFPDLDTGEHLRPETVSKRFKAALLRAEVGPVEMREYKIRGKIVEKPFPLLKLHDLRDTFGTYLMMNPDIAPREVQEWLGHANLATTSERYSQFRPLPDAAERMAASYSDREPVEVEQPALAAVA